jgi:protein O-mannosyl-transferase
MSVTSTKTRQKRNLSLLLTLLAIVPYLNSLEGTFVFDDLGVIRDNPAVSGDHASALRLLTWVYHAGGLYRPVTMLTYLANQRVDHSPVGYHIVNVCLHGLVTLAMFHLARRVLGSLSAAVAAAALFAVHPVHTEAVSNIIGRAELLAALFLTLSLLAFVRAHEEGGKRRRLWHLVSLLTFAVGLLAKENAFTAIPLCALLHLWLRQPRSLRRTAFAVAPHAVVGLGYLILRIVIIGSATLPDYARAGLLDNPLVHVALLPRLGTAVVVLWQYVSLLAVPLVLSADYSFNQIPVVLSPSDPRFLLASISLALTGVVFLLSIRRAPEIAVAVAFTALALSLTANVIVPIGTIKAERLLYLPSVGWCMGCSWLLAGKGRARHRGCLLVLGVLVAAYAGRTWARNPVWANDLALWKATVDTSPRSAKAHNNLAVAYDSRGLLDQAMLHYRKSFAIDPEYEGATFGIGEVYQKKGIPSGAFAWYEKTVDLDWQMTKAHYNMGKMFLDQRNFVSAEAAFRTVLQEEPDNPSALIGLALSALGQGERLQARFLIEQATPLVGKERVVMNMLSRALLALNDVPPR